MRFLAVYRGLSPLPCLAIPSRPVDCFEGFFMKTIGVSLIELERNHGLSVVRSECFACASCAWVIGSGAICTFIAVTIMENDVCENYSYPKKA